MRATPELPAPAGDTWPGGQIVQAHEHRTAHELPIDSIETTHEREAALCVFLPARVSRWGAVIALKSRSITAKSVGSAPRILLLAP